MTHLDVQESLGVYALNAVDKDERELIERHLGVCAECSAEVAEHREVAAMLSATENSAPLGAWTGIAEQLTWRDRAAKTASNVVPLKRRWLRPVAVAAALVVLGAAAIVQSVRLNGVQDDLRTEQETVAALSDELASPQLSRVASSALGDPASQLVSLGSQETSANAIIVLMPDGTGYLTQHTLEPLPADRTYQLWAIVDGQVISAGVLGSDPGVVPFHIDVEGFEGFAITEEVVGGVVASENQPVVAWLAA